MKIQRLLPCLLLAPLAAAQTPTDFDGTKQGFLWSGGCQAAVVFKNTSGVNLCDLWVSIGDVSGAEDNVENDPEIARIAVTNSSGSALWHVDDNEDGDDDEPLENDPFDSTPDTGTTPPGSAEGSHRTQAHLDSDCIAPGDTFTLRLCDKSGNPLDGRPIYLWGTSSNEDPQRDGGDGGVKIADKPKRLSKSNPSGDIHISSGPWSPGSPRHTFRLINDSLLDPMPRVRIVPNDPDFDLLEVHADQSFTFSAGQLEFQPALAPGASAQIWWTLDHLSQQGPTTDVHLVRLGDAPEIYCTPKQNSQGCLPMIGSFGLPSVSSAQPFGIFCQQVINQKSGLLFYGFAPKGTPFQGGTLCVDAPTKRTPVQSSAGSPPPDNCTGHFVYDFNARIQSGSDPLLALGTEVFTQWWYRDPQSQSTTGLSNGLHFVIDL